MADMVARLDDMGRPAWIAIMVLGFILFWPFGLAVLAFLIWSGRMGCGRHGEMTRWQQHMADRWGRGMRAWGSGGDQPRNAGFSRSGNRAFDEYREETLRRLEDEEREFRAFLERLRMAKDRSEFDQFMAERRNQGKAGEPPRGEEPPRQS